MEKAGTTTDLEKIIDAIKGLPYEDGIYAPFTMRACDLPVYVRILCRYYRLGQEWKICTSHSHPGKQ